MQKTKIEWCDYTWNPVKGLCPQACWYCYARAMYKRFKWNPELRLDQKELSQLILFKTNYPASKRIFVGSTIDLFHPEIPKDWIQTIVNLTGLCSEHTFIFLTKNPARYAEFDFPDNCWLGVTVTRDSDHPDQRIFTDKKNLSFISYEPLLECCRIQVHSRWNIIGALTGPQAQKYTPDKKWIDKMVFTSQVLNTPVFLKNNLKEVWGEDLIQEYPRT